MPRVRTRANRAGSGLLRWAASARVTACSVDFSRYSKEHVDCPLAASGLVLSLPRQAAVVLSACSMAQLCCWAVITCLGAGAAALV